MDIRTWGTFFPHYNKKMGCNTSQESLQQKDNNENSAAG